MNIYYDKKEIMGYREVLWKNCSSYFVSQTCNSCTYFLYKKYKQKN